MPSDNDVESNPSAGPGVPLNSNLSISSTVLHHEFSYVNVHKIPGCESVNGRAPRLVLADKTDKATSSSLSFGCIKTLLSRTTHTTPIETVSLSSVQQLQSSTPFQLLPPLPRASSLQLPCIMDTSPCASLLPSVLLAQSEATQNSVKPIPLGVTPKPLTNDLSAKLGFPSKLSPFTHPNSPYVPWTPEAKRKFLPPCVMPSAPDSHGRPYSDANFGMLQSKDHNAYYSPSKPNQKRQKVSRGFEKLTFLVGKNIKYAAQRISRLKKPLTMVGVQSAASVSSLDCSSSNTLAIWLRHQRMLFEETMDTSKEMSLDDYEQFGEGDEIPDSMPDQDVGARVYSYSDSHLDCARDREMSMPGGWIFD